MYLVKNPADNKYHAMKVVPKDKIKYDTKAIDNPYDLVAEAVDEHPFVSSRNFVFN